MLADLDGERPDGTWTLQVSDLAGGDVGTINLWSIKLILGDMITTTDADGVYEFRNLPPGPLTIRQQLGHLRSPTQPRPAGEEVVERFELDLSQYEQRESGYGSTLSAAAAYEGANGLIPGRWLVGRADAEARGIADDDLIRLWNHRGSVVCAAQVTERLRPGTVCAYSGSAQYRPVGEPGRSTDLGGCVNMLNPKEPITKRGHGMKPNSVLIQVEKWTGVDTWQPAEAV